MNNVKRFSIAFALLLMAFCGLPDAFAQNRTQFAGNRNALTFAYGAPGVNVSPLLVGNGPVASGTGVNLIMQFGTTTLGDGTTIVPLNVNASVTIGIGANAETVTPTAVSCATPAIYLTCSITVTTAHSHGIGDPVSSGTLGLVEAINAANAVGGGVVTVDSAWFSAGGVKATITGVTAATPKVWVMDNSGVGPVWYGKSGVTTAAYSSVNNDMVFTVAIGSAKTLSQTYATAPTCVGTDLTAAAAVKMATSVTAVTPTGTGTDSIQVFCALQK